jgi:hypothetical protein
LANLLLASLHLLLLLSNERLALLEQHLALVVSRLEILLGLEEKRHLPLSVLAQDLFLFAQPTGFFLLLALQTCALALAPVEIALQFFVPPLDVGHAALALSQRGIFLINESTPLLEESRGRFKFLLQARRRRSALLQRDSLGLKLLFERP